MNFDYMPELRWRWGYFAVLGVMVIAIIGLIWWFWVRKWIVPGRKAVSRARFLVIKHEKLKGYRSKTPNV